MIIDGTRGEIIIDPDEETLGKYRDSQARHKTVSERLESLRQQPSATRDGVRILLLGNIEFPEEVEHCTQRGADGIGLYRTEFLYLRSGREPTEEDHFAAYTRVVSAFHRRRGRHSHARPGGRQVSQRASGLSSDGHVGAGAAQHSADAAESAVVQNPVTRYSASGDLGQRRHHVPAGLVALGAAAGQDDSRGRQGRSGRRGGRVQKERPRRYDGRGSLRSPLGGRVCAGRSTSSRSAPTI